MVDANRLELITATLKVQVPGQYPDSMQYCPWLLAGGNYLYNELGPQAAGKSSTA